MSKNNNTNIQQNKVNQTTDNVDQIREILFGTQERELKHRFEKFEQETKKVQKEILQKLEQTQIDTHTRFNKKSKKLSKKIKTLKALQKDQILDIKRTQIKHKNSLQLEIKTLKEELIDVINTKNKSLKSSKISKNVLAKMMLDIAINLKGSKNVNKKVKKINKAKKKEK